MSLFQFQEQYPCQHLQLSVLSLYKSGRVIGKRSHMNVATPATNARLTIPENKDEINVKFNIINWLQTKSNKNQAKALVIQAQR